jgi:hypothetical protein
MSIRVVSILATMALVPVELSFVAWYMLYWDLFPKYSLRRIVAWLLFIASVVIVPLLQIQLYKSINLIERADSLFISYLIITESVLSTALMFLFLILRRLR